MRRKLRRLCRSSALESALKIAFACLLLAVETFAIVHPFDLDAHSNGEPCKICVGVAGLGSAATVDPQVLVVDISTPDLAPLPAYVFVSAAAVPQVARGPPLAS